MSVHIMTGNGLDIVYEYDAASKPVLRGLFEHKTRNLIPLADPWGLVKALERFLKNTEALREDPYSITR